MICNIRFGSYFIYIQIGYIEDIIYIYYISLCPEWKGKEKKGNFLYLKDKLINGTRYVK